MLTGHVFIATSLDGYIARKDGDINWLISRDEPSEDHGYDDFIKDMDGIIMGRGSYEKVVSFNPWPYSKFVVVLSSKLAGSQVPKELEGKVQFLNLRPKEAMNFLAKKGWKRVYVDGGQVIQSFLRERLITDMVITQVPVLLGNGRRLFGSLETDMPLRHVDTKSFPSGLVQSKYKVTE